jgi:hypothetical protein
MMKAILGSALGGLVAGAVALMASAQARAPESARTDPAALAAFDAGAIAPAAGSVLASTAVECAPHQQATLQRVRVAGREVAQVVCTAAAPASAAYALPPAAYAVPAAATPDIVERPAVYTPRTTPRVRRAASTQREVVEPTRSWQKSALIIGGSAAAGAGVGAIAGGKKGALIGAAIGGGSGALYEAIKRR